MPPTRPLWEAGTRREVYGLCPNTEMTSPKVKTNLPTHIALQAERTGLQKDSIVLLEQVRTIDKHRLKEKMGKLDEDAMRQVNEAIGISFGLYDT